MAAADTGHLQTVQQLLLAGADVNVADFGGRTALILAVQEGHSDVVKALVARKDIKLNAKTGDGKTALTIAMKLGRREITEMQRAAGARE